MRLDRASLTVLGVAATLSGCQQEYQVTPKPPEVDPGQVTECDFSRVDDTDFYQYDCNPVFTTTGEDWAADIGSTAFAVTEVLGHPFYQIWYQGVPDDAEFGDYGLGYAVSDAGTAWTPSPANPLLTEPREAAFDASSMDAMQVVWDPATEQYVMLYQGINIPNNDWGLGVATTPDGQAWERLEQNPIFDLTKPQGDVRGYCWPLGLALGEKNGFEGYIAGYDRNNGPCQVYRIDSPNIRDWEPNDVPVLEAGEDGEWDDQGMISLAIAALGESRYMFYVGFGDWEEHPGYRSSKDMYLGWATRGSGGWVKARDPLPLNQTRDGRITAVAAVTVGPRIHLWITDEYDGVQAVGYFLYDPDREDTEATE